MTAVRLPHAESELLNLPSGITTRLAAITVMLVSWLLLTTGLNTRSLWVDEFLTLETARLPLSGVVTTAAADIHPPLYFVLVHGLIGTIGNSDFALRWLSAAAGLVSVAAMFTLAREMLGHRTAMLAMLLLGIAPAFVEFSRMARYYSLLVGLGLLSTYFLLKALKHGGVRYWAAYGLVNLALLFTFYPACVLLLSQVIWLPITRIRRSAVLHWLLTQVTTLMVFFPFLIAVAGHQVIAVGSGGGVDFARSMLGFVLGIGALIYTFAVGQTLFPWNPIAWAGIALIALLVFRATISPTGDNWRSRQVAALPWITLATSAAGVSFITTYVATGTPFLNVPVRALFALPFGLLILAAGLVQFGARFRLLILGGLIAVWSLAIYNDLTGQQNLNPIYLTPSREAAEYVTLHMERGDWVVADYDSVFGHYFLNSQTSRYFFYTDQGDDIAALVRMAPPRIWLITINRDQSERFAASDQARTYISTTYRRADLVELLSIDPTYQRLKNMVLRRVTYGNRLNIELYAR